MILLRQKYYSKASKMIKGVLIATPIGTLIGVSKGFRMGEKKMPEKEKEEAAKKRIEENKKKIEENNKNFPIYKELAKKERRERGPKKDWDNLDKVEIEMADDLWKDISRENKVLKRENKKLESGDYSIINPIETDTGPKYIARGGKIGTAVGLGTGLLAGYGVHKLTKFLKK